ncbi:hypothetical protein PWT90_05917 [Aphanocladium album]|nr:hypothetical protein PWT90_05917 [Aphanocladium album]
MLARQSQAQTLHGDDRGKRRQNYGRLRPARAPEPHQRQQGRAPQRRAVRRSGPPFHHYRDKAPLEADLENEADFDVNSAAKVIVKGGKKPYSLSFERIATRVGDIKAKMSVEDLKNNKSKFQQLEACAYNINVDRRADMSKYLVSELNRRPRALIPSSPGRIPASDACFINPTRFKTTKPR